LAARLAISHVRHSPRPCDPRRCSCRRPVRRLRHRLCRIWDGTRRLGSLVPCAPGGRGSTTGRPQLGGGANCWPHRGAKGLRLVARLALSCRWRVRGSTRYCRFGGRFPAPPQNIRGRVSHPLCDLPTVAARRARNWRLGRRARRCHHRYRRRLSRRFRRLVRSPTADLAATSRRGAGSSTCNLPTLQSHRPDPRRRRYGRHRADHNAGAEDSFAMPSGHTPRCLYRRTCLCRRVAADVSTRGAGSPLASGCILLVQALTP
jgi:hypothetical protein